MFNRPKIICHMTTSLDGKVTGDFLNEQSSIYGSQIYYQIHKDMASSFLCGRKTMEESFTKEFYPNLEKFKNTNINYDDFIVHNEEFLYAIAIDRYGKLGWKENRIIDEDPGYDGRIIIEVVTEKAPKEYLAYLKSIDLPYIVCGHDDLDISLMLKKLYYTFGIKKLLLEGGSIINSVFQRENLIDELSLVMVPVVAGENAKSLFDSSNIENFSLDKTEIYKDVLHLKYYKKSHNTYSENIDNTLLNLSTVTGKIDISYKNSLEIFKPNTKIISYNKIKNPVQEFKYISCEKWLINPVFLKYLPQILNINEKILQDIFSRRLIAIKDIKNDTVNFVKPKLIEKFEGENFYKFTINEFIEYQLKNIDLNCPKTKNQQEIFAIFKANNLSLEDIFIDKILVPSYICDLIESKKEDNHVLTFAFLKLLLRLERLAKILIDAPKLIVEFETTLVQETLNNYYKLLLEYIILN